MAHAAFYMKKSVISHYRSVWILLSILLTTFKTDVYLFFSLFFFFCLHVSIQSERSLLKRPMILPRLLMIYPICCVCPISYVHTTPPDAHTQTHFVCMLRSAGQVANQSTRTLEAGKLVSKFKHHLLIDNYTNVPLCCSD